jgi:hypothetical protein
MDKETIEFIFDKVKIKIKAADVHTIRAKWGK